MRNKQSVWIMAGLSALLLSGVVFADNELDKLMNPVDKSKPTSKPKPHPKPVKPHKKHHRAEDTESDFKLTEEQAQQAIAKMESDRVSITGGCFQMGSPESEPERNSNEKQHQVCVKDFQLGKYEVTQAQWQAVMGNNPSNFKGENLPVEQVSWDDVQTFLQKLNAKTGKTYRLPTEAEWEYAARAGTTTAYYWGNSIDCSKANYDDCKTDKTKPVGSYSANQFGLYDMSGNVWEWTCSAYVGNYDGSELKCDINGSGRVVHGGSWSNDGGFVRSAYRSGDGADDRDVNLGFRLALGLPAQ